MIPHDVPQDTTYDIHLGCDRISSRIEQGLLDLGFRPDRFIGVTPGIVRARHFVAHPKSAEALKQDWDRTTQLLASASSDEFLGFCEAEYTLPTYCIPVAAGPFREEVPFPLGRVKQARCPIGMHKTFDVHIAGAREKIDPRLDRLLSEDVGFYVVDIEKPSGEVRRCYTIQLFDESQAAPLLSALHSYFNQAGGFVGKIKMEFVYAMASFPTGSPVPPVVLEGVRI